jgi:hypothetical protein
MSVSSRRNRYIVISTVVLTSCALIALFIFTSEESIVWCGAFSQVEYQLVFKDERGRPVVGIELAAEDEKGNLSFRYPVSDFTRVNALTSDADGVLMFHHVCNGIEFGGKYTYKRGYMPASYGKCSPPVFRVRCLFGAKEVYAFEFSALDSDFLKSTGAYPDSKAGPEVERLCYEPPEYPMTALDEGIEPKLQKYRFPVYRRLIVLKGVAHPEKGDKEQKKGS